MLEELLLSMVGYTGGSIKDFQNSFEVNPGLETLNMSEKELINRICALGFYYKQIQTFIEDNRRLCVDNIKARVTNNKANTKMQIEDDGQLDPNLNLKSLYVRKVGLIFESILEKYYSSVLAIENRFLSGQLININTFAVEFKEFYEVFPEIIKIIERLKTKENYLPLFLDHLYEKRMSGNTYLRDLYTVLFEGVYEILYALLCKWLKYGKIADYEEPDFFIKKMNRQSAKKSKMAKLNDWDNDYLASYSRIPKNLFGVKTCKKILFIGKAMKILIKEQGLVSPACKFIQQTIDCLKNYEAFAFERTIEQIRIFVSKTFIDLLIKVNNIKEDITLAKSFYLLTDDNFYSYFIEESMDVLNGLVTKYTEFEINNRTYQNALIRLEGLQNKNRHKRLKFLIKSKGFVFSDFTKLTNLQFMGDVEQHDGIVNLSKSFSYSADALSNPNASVWHTIKQDVESGFTTEFCFRFKRAPQNSFQPVQLEEFQRNSSQMVCLSFIIQADQEIKSYKKNRFLNNLNFIKEYVIINFGFFIEKGILATINPETVSFITIYNKDAKAKEPSKLYERKFTMEELNFADQDVQYCRIEYRNRELSLYLKHDELSKYTNIQPLFSISLEIDKLIHLDISRSFLGFMNNSSLGLFDIKLNSWKFITDRGKLADQAFSSLVPFYDVAWPGSIIVGGNFISKLETIFSSLLPIKILKFKVKDLYFYLAKGRVKSSSDRGYMMANKVRTYIDHILNALLGYIYIDLIDDEWSVLQAYLENVSDFEDLRKRLNAFVESVYSQLFFKYSEMSGFIDRILSTTDSFIRYVYGFADKSEIEKVKFSDLVYRELEEATVGLIRFLHYLSDSGVDKHFSKLITRLNYNNYFDTHLIELSIN